MKPPRETVYYGTFNDELVFIPAGDAEHLVRIQRAAHAAKTWGEFKELAGEPAYDELLEVLSDAAGRRRKPRPGAKLDFWSLGPVGEGDYPPNPMHDMLNWMPEDIIEACGKRCCTALGEELVTFPANAEEALVKRLRKAGYDCVRKEDVVLEALGAR